MIYTEKQRARLLRLYQRLTKSGYRFYNSEDGFGQTAIFTMRYEPIPDSEFWVHDFVEGRLSGNHIVKALLTGSTPYVCKADGERKKRRSEPKRSTKAQLTQVSSEHDALAAEADEPTPAAMTASL